jgi:4-hydroxy-tetrahydrodipicolinate reductase
MPDTVSFVRYCTYARDYQSSNPVRDGGIVGEHTSLLAVNDELLTSSHSARSLPFRMRCNRASARVARHRKPGLCSMMDVSGF